MTDQASTYPPPTYTSSPAQEPKIALNLGYFKSAPGIIKLIQVSLGIFCMALAAPAWTNGTHWFLFVVVTAFVATTLWCFMYLLSLREAVNLPIDWLLTELLNTGITTVLYLVSVIVQFCSIEKDVTSNVFGGILGAFNFLAYAAGCFLLHRDWKDSHPVAAFDVPGFKSTNA